MNKYRFIKDVSVAFLAQGVALLVSVLTTLLAPKVLGVEGYGYWQLFLFYGTYVGVFQIGVIDGVYLICGGNTRDEIDKEKVSFSFKFVVVSQVVVACVISFAIAPFVGDANRCFVVAAIGLYTLLSNLVNYFCYLFQAMNETRRSSLISLIDRGCFLVSLIMLLLFCGDNFQPFIITCLASRAIALVVCIALGRDVCFVKCADRGKGRDFLISAIKVGIVLMLANSASQFVIGFVRAIVDEHWGIEVFSVVSLSFSLTSFVMTFVSQVGMVLFPALRRASKEGLNRFYHTAKNGLSLVLPFVYVLYCPLALFIEVWLPSYAASIGYLAILMPVCVFDAQMNICGTTVLKVMRRGRQLLLVNVVAIFVAAVGAFVACQLFDSIELSLLAALVAVVVRCYLASFALRDEFGNSNKVLAFEELVLAGLFVVTATQLGFVVSLIVSTVAYAAFLALNRETLNNTVKELRA